MSTEKLDRLNKLREKRKKIAQAKIDQDKLEEYAPKILSTLSTVIGKEISINDFSEKTDQVFNFNISKKLEDSEGLVEAYISKSRAKVILDCISTILGDSSGKIAIDGCRQIGLMCVENFEIIKLLDIADNLSDSILFYPLSANGGILIDCYRSIGLDEEKDFSIVAQGVDLELRLSECFD